MELNNVEFTNNLLYQNIALLTEFPMTYYNQLWNTNNKLVKDNKKLNENNINLRKRNFDYQEEIHNLKTKLKPKPRKKQKTSRYEFKNYDKCEESFDDEKINDIIKNIKSIDDIILLSDKWINIRHNNILQKLYNLITPLQKLQKMIGLTEIKENIFKKIIYYIKNSNNEEYLHTIICGPPGVGKTQLAKIYANIFVKLGILKNDSFIEAKRDDLVGEYLGQTAPKTRKLLEKALGGVIFIDEAYSLGNAEKRDSFSKEAIDMINQYLSEYKNDFMMIVAGYENELEECFFAYNPGLKRRFSSLYKINSYSKDELVDIFKIKIKQTKFDNKIKDNKLNEFFEENYDNFNSYGGDIEKLINEIKYTQSLRTFNMNKESNKIIFEDLKNAFKIIKDYKNINQIVDEPPFGLYT